jgi:eukaryotic-like serine/threonine-protein kinase
MSEPVAAVEFPSPTDPTVESIPGSVSGWTSSAGSVSQLPAGRLGAGLVQGAGVELTSETQDLLRSRLRTAAILLFLGFAAFLVRHYFRTDFSRPAEAFLFAFHAAATVVLGAVAATLCHRSAMPLWWLRLSEWATFGLPAVLFLATQYYITLSWSQNKVLDFPEGLWLVLIYTYALFIPNTRRRAAVVIGVLCMLPMALLLGMTWWYPDVRMYVTADQIVGLMLMFCLAGAGGVFGVNLIGSLRREAFEARQLGQYKLTRRIGAGGMGEVYLAEHQLLKRPCVVKLIRPDKTDNPRVLARFQREVRATAKLSHWNTVEIYDYGATAEGTFYYVMEYLPGMSLSELVERFGPLPPERVIYLLRQACDALGEAHGVGLIHRDIKPGNIFVAERGGVYDVSKLLDFGLVKPLWEADEEPGHLTAEGTITGSPLFMSPEQALGDAKPDARSDIYSLGAVGYYLLTAHPPFEADKAIKVMFAHANEPVVPPSRHCPTVPADLERVVLRCLAKNPADRFPDAARLEEALAACESTHRWNRTLAAEWWQGRVAKEE